MVSFSHVTFHRTCTNQILRLIEPLIAFRNRRRIAFAAKKLKPIFEERKAIIEHNKKNEKQIKAPVRHNANYPLIVFLVPGLTYLLGIGGPASTYHRGSRKIGPPNQQ